MLSSELTNKIDFLFFNRSVEDKRKLIDKEGSDTGQEVKLFDFGTLNIVFFPRINNNIYFNIKVFKDQVYIYWSLGIS